MPSLIFYERDERVCALLVELLLEATPELTPIGQARDLDQLLEMCQTCPWDVVVIDLLTVTTNKLAFMDRLRRACPETPVVAICFNLERQKLTGLMSLGVYGLVAAEDVPEALPCAIRAGLAGEAYHSETIRAALSEAASG
jgi:DNA-binding NarL/FixJ family response regulator